MKHLSTFLFVFLLMVPFTKLYAHQKPLDLENSVKKYMEDKKEFLEELLQDTEELAAQRHPGIIAARQEYSDQFLNFYYNQLFDYEKTLNFIVANYAGRPTELYAFTKEFLEEVRTFRMFIYDITHGEQITAEKIRRQINKPPLKRIPKVKNK